MQHLKMMFFSAVISLFMAFVFLSPASYALVQEPELDIQEFWDGNATVKFTVNTSYDDIIGFAVGNNYGFDYAGTSVSGWQAAVAVNQNLADWKIAEVIPGNPPSVAFSDLPDWMVLDSLDAYRAFVFFTDTGSPLSSGTTSGFWGLSFAPDSPFLAFRGDITNPGEITITSGDTSMVPVPGALLLFGSGMLALAGIRRKKK